MFTVIVVQEAVIKKTLKPEEKDTFSNWMKRRSLILITHLEEVTSGSKVIVGAVHITWDILQLPALQMLEVSGAGLTERGVREGGVRDALN